VDPLLQLQLVVVQVEGEIGHRCCLRSGAREIAAHTLVRRTP
jgi:hypothetical protein